MDCEREVDVCSEEKEEGERGWTERHSQEGRNREKREREREDT